MQKGEGKNKTLGRRGVCERRIVGAKTKEESYKQVLDYGAPGRGGGSCLREDNSESAWVGPKNPATGDKVFFS